MAASSSSSSGSWIYDVFPSFSGEVRNTFLSHLLAELKRKSINTFMDDKMERSCPIGEELISAIRESRIAIVIFSINYASSTWCLDELVEIHKCYKERNQMVIPIFYKVDPSDVSEQVGKFGEVFQKTCENVSKEKQPDDQKQKWKQALADIAKFAGEDVQSWHNEAATIQKIASDVFNKLNTPSKCSDDLVGIEAHLEKIESILCLESEDARMVGIWGQSGIGKSTIGRELFRKLSREKYKFALHAFLTYRSTNSGDVYGMKLSWEKELLSEIFSEKDIEIKHSGKVEQKLKRKKVLIVLDDVDDLEFLKTLVGKTEWFGPGSRIIVITQNRQLLRAHKIDIIYEVELPSEGLARKMLCRYAFGQDDPPDEFRELADEVAKLAGNLPLGLRVLGSSLKENPKGEWVQMMPSLRTGLNGDIMKTLRVSYDRLDKKDQDMFHYIGYSFCPYVVDLEFNEDKFRLQKLVEKSLVRITPRGTIEMHNLLEKLAREIDCEESGGNLRKRRYLTDYKEIQEVLTNKIGTETVLGIHFKEFLKTEILSIDKNSFEGMRSLQHLEVHESCVDVPQGLDYLPSKLRTLIWLRYSLKCLPSSFKAECLVKLIMRYSDLEKLWEGTQPLGSLKMLNLSGSRYLKEIPDLSNAINLEKLFLNRCESLVTLPSSINATKLRTLAMSGCTKLESIPTPLILESLDDLWLSNCSRLRNFPQIEMKKSISSNGGRIEIEIEDCLWNKNLPGLYFLDCLMRCIPCFRKEYLFSLTMRGSKMLEKLWEGAQSIGSLENMDLSECENLKEIPDLSKATNLVKLKLNNCISLEKLPSTIGNLHKLVRLEMKGCTGLKVLPTDVNLSSLETLDLSGCSSLRTFPQISNGIKYLYLENTAIEKIPSCIVNFTRLTVLMMYCCKLRNISPEIFRLTSLKEADFTGCIVDIMGFTTMEYTRKRSWEEDDRSYSIYSSESLDKQYANFIFRNCFKLDRDARELIIRSCFKHVSLPCGEVPTYFTHRAYGNTVNVTLPQSSLYQEFLRFKVCIVVDFLTNVEVGWCRPTDVSVGFNGIHYEGLYMKDHLGSCKTDHLIFWCLKFKPEGLPSKLAFNDVEFKFSYDNKRIKECGVRFLNVTGEKGDVVVEVGRSKKRMRMTAETSEEHINLPYDQIVADTGLAARNLELSLGQGEKSSVSSYHSLEVETLCVGLRDGLWITEQQDEEIPIMVSGTGRTIILSYMRKAQDLHWKGMRSSIFGLPDIRQNTPVQTESSQLAQTASHNKPKFPHNKLKLTKKVYVPKLAKLKITPKPVNSAKASQSENPANKVQQPALSLQESSQLAQTASHNKPKFPHNKLKLTKKVYVPKLAKLKITPKPVNSAKASQSENPANKVQQPALSLQEQDKHKAKDKETVTQVQGKRRTCTEPMPTHNRFEVLDDECTN